MRGKGRETENPLQQLLFGNAPKAIFFYISGSVVQDFSFPSAGPKNNPSLGNNPFEPA
jgi:hypothetical protein